LIESAHTQADESESEREESDNSGRVFLDLDRSDSVAIEKTTHFTVDLITEHPMTHLADAVESVSTPPDASPEVADGYSDALVTTAPNPSRFIINVVIEGFSKDRVLTRFEYYPRNLVPFSAL
jgi:hypothetical protein